MEKEYIKASEYAKKMSLHIRTVYRYCKTQNDLIKISI